MFFITCEQTSQGIYEIFQHDLQFKIILHDIYTLNKFYVHNYYYFFSFPPFLKINPYV